jgi:actin-related protein 9
MAHMQLCRMFFERFNVAGFTFIERPLASLYAANLITGVVIEIGQDETDYIACFESQLHHGSALTVPVGIRDCERHLGSILRANTSVTSVLSSPPRGSVDAEDLDMLLVGLARFLWQNGYCKIPIEGGEVEKDPLEDGNLDIAAVLLSGKERAIIEAAGTKKKVGQNKADKEREKEMAALDLISISFRDFPPIMVGKERHRFCEPLFDPTVLNACSIPPQAVVKMDGLSQPTPPVPKNRDFMLPLQGAVHAVVKAAPFSQRSMLYFGLVITGQLANVHGEPNLFPFPCCPIRGLSHPHRPEGSSQTAT